jgi:hypothetical protein
MSAERDRSAVHYCSDDNLGYERCRTPFQSGRGLMLDDPYRLAHLPLVAPDHPDVNVGGGGSPYDMGRHETIFSLVLPLAAETLYASDAYRELEAELRAENFAPKIAWDLLERRRDRLHATVCGTLSRIEAPQVDAHQREALARLGPLHMEVRGLFSGNINIGRLYLRVYPERRGGGNVCHEIQRIFSRPPGDLFLIGLFNLTDHLDAGEAEGLDELLQRWWDRLLLRFEADHLWLMGASDDLVLDSTIAETIALTQAG